MPDGALTRDLARLATPRLAGTPEEAALRDWAAEELAAAGAHVRREPFAYDPFWVRRGFAVPVGLAFFAFLLGATGAVSPGIAALAGTLLALPPVLVAALGTPRMDRRRVLAAENVVGTLGDRSRVRGPDLCLMAHVDSKSQRISFVARSAFAFVALAGAVGALALALFGAPEITTRVACALAALGTAVLATSGSGNASPGALDNATGVAAVLELARRLAPVVDSAGARVEVVITTGEEDGLVGAHRFAEAHRESHRHTPVINVDTIGPGGDRVHVVTHSRAVSGRLVVAIAALDTAATAHGLALAIRRAPFPAGVDSHPLARAGIPALTVATGSIGETFRHLHRPGDTLERVDHERLERVVDVLEVASREFLGASPKGAVGA